MDTSRNSHTKRPTTGNEDGCMYVVDNLRHLANVKAGDETWWCVRPSTKTGENSAIYSVGKGIIMLIRIIGEPTLCNNFCSYYGLKTAPVTIIALFAPPLTAKYLRAHPTLSSLPALARNFQGKTFRLPLNLFKEMQSLAANASKETTAN